MAPGKSRSQNNSKKHLSQSLHPSLRPAIHSSPQLLLCKTGPLEQNSRTLVLQSSVHIKPIPTSPHTSAVLLLKTHSKQTQFSNHEGILILQLFKFFNLLSQKEYPVRVKEREQRKKRKRHSIKSGIIYKDINVVHYSSRPVLNIAFESW